MAARKDIADDFAKLVDSVGKGTKLEIVDEETGEVRYTLQYNRATVKKMSRDGFRIDAIDDSVRGVRHGRRRQHPQLRHVSA